MFYLRFDSANLDYTKTLIIPIHKLTTLFTTNRKGVQGNQNGGSRNGLLPLRMVFQSDGCPRDFEKDPTRDLWTGDVRLARRVCDSAGTGMASLFYLVDFTGHCLQAGSCCWSPTCPGLGLMREQQQNNPEHSKSCILIKCKIKALDARTRHIAMRVVDGVGGGRGRAAPAPLPAAPRVPQPEIVLHAVLA